MLHTKFRGNRTFPEKIFEGFYYNGHGGHLGHVTSIISSNFDFHVSTSLHTNFGSEWHSSF